MKSFSQRHWPLLAVVAILVAGAALAHGGYIDPTYLAAAPLLFPMGNMTTDVPAAKLLRAAAGKREEIVKAMAAVTAAVPDGGNLSAEQQASLDKHILDLKSLDGDIGRLKSTIEAQRGSVEVGAILGTKPRIEDDPKRGFAHAGEYYSAVYKAGIGAGVDERLLIGAATPGTTFGNEGAGADGGFVVPPEYSTEITKLSLDTDAFISRTDNTPISGNSMVFPSDETTPWGANGVRVYWQQEAALATATKPLVKPNVMRLNKLFGLVPVTDELLADAPAMGSYLNSLLARSLKWKINDAIMNGTGSGQPLGVLQGGGLAVVAKDAGQATGTLSATNVAAMYAAMPAGYLADAEWLVTPDLLPKLITLQLGNFAIWTPPTQGFAQAPGGFLFGKPITPTQTCQAFSSQGDIVFVNFKQYKTITAGGVQLAQSMHLYFDADSTAFRATFRVDGQPTFKQVIAQARGAQALSPYVTLQAR